MLPDEAAKFPMTFLAGLQENIRSISDSTVLPFTYVPLRSEFESLAISLGISPFQLELAFKTQESKSDNSSKIDKVKKCGWLYKEDMKIPGQRLAAMGFNEDKFRTNIMLYPQKIPDDQQAIIWELAKSNNSFDAASHIDISPELNAERQRREIEQLKEATLKRHGTNEPYFFIAPLKFGREVTYEILYTMVQIKSLRVDDNIRQMSKKLVFGSTIPNISYLHMLSYIIDPSNSSGVRKDAYTVFDSIQDGTRHIRAVNIEERYEIYSKNQEISDALMKHSMSQLGLGSEAGLQKKNMQRYIQFGHSLLSLSNTMGITLSKSSESDQTSFVSVLRDFFLLSNRYESLYTQYMAAILRKQKSRKACINFKMTRDSTVSRVGKFVRSIGAIESIDSMLQKIAINEKIENKDKQFYYRKLFSRAAKSYIGDPRPLIFLLKDPVSQYFIKTIQELPSDDEVIRFSAKVYQENSLNISSGFGAIINAYQMPEKEFEENIRFPHYELVRLGFSASGSSNHGDCKQKHKNLAIEGGRVFNYIPANISSSSDVLEVTLKNQVDNIKNSMIIDSNHPILIRYDETISKTLSKKLDLNQAIGAKRGKITEQILKISLIGHKMKSLKDSNDSKAFKKYRNLLGETMLTKVKLERLINEIVVIENLILDNDKNMRITNPSIVDNCVKILTKDVSYTAPPDGLTNKEFSYLKRQEHLVRKMIELVEESSQLFEKVEYISQYSEMALDYSKLTLIASPIHEILEARSILFLTVPLDAKAYYDTFRHVGFFTRTHADEMINVSANPPCFESVKINTTTPNEQVPYSKYTDIVLNLGAVTAPVVAAVDPNLPNALPDPPIRVATNVFTPTVSEKINHFNDTSKISIYPDIKSHTGQLMDYLLGLNKQFDFVEVEFTIPAANLVYIMSCILLADRDFTTPRSYPREYIEEKKGYINNDPNEFYMNEDPVMFNTIKETADQKFYIPDNFKTAMGLATELSYTDYFVSLDIVVMKISINSLAHCGFFFKTFNQHDPSHNAESKQTASGYYILRIIMRIAKIFVLRKISHEMYVRLGTYPNQIITPMLIFVAITSVVKTTINQLGYDDTSITMEQSFKVYSASMMTFLEIFRFIYKFELLKYITLCKSDFTLDYNDCGFTPFIEDKRLSPMNNVRHLIGKRGQPDSSIFNDAIGQTISVKRLKTSGFHNLRDNNPPNYSSLFDPLSNLAANQKNQPATLALFDLKFVKEGDLWFLKGRNAGATSQSIPINYGGRFYFDGVTEEIYQKAKDTYSEETYKKKELDPTDGNMALEMANNFDDIEPTNVYKDFGFSEFDDQKNQKIIDYKTRLLKEEMKQIHNAIAGNNSDPTPLKGITL